MKGTRGPGLVEEPAFCIGSVSRWCRRGLQGCPGLVRGLVLSKELAASKLLEPHSGSVTGVRVPDPLKIGKGKGGHWCGAGGRHSAREGVRESLRASRQEGTVHGTRNFERIPFCFCAPRTWGGGVSLVTALPGAGTMVVNSSWGD